MAKSSSLGAIFTGRTRNLMNVWRRVFCVFFFALVEDARACAHDPLIHRFCVCVCAPGVNNGLSWQRMRLYKFHHENMRSANKNDFGKNRNAMFAIHVCVSVCVWYARM